MAITKRQLTAAIDTTLRVTGTAPTRKLGVAGIGQANGIAQLDADGLVPVEQLPPLSSTPYEETFDNSEIVANVIDFAHGKDGYPPVVLIDSTGLAQQNVVRPLYLSRSTVRFDFTEWGPISGTWTVSIG